jgi:hypothetical protein
MAHELSVYLERLKSAQTEWSNESLTRPSDKTEFGYGRACGTLQGLKRAEQLLTQVMEEDDDDERK